MIQFIEGISSEGINITVRNEMRLCVAKTSSGDSEVILMPATKI